MILGDIVNPFLGMIGLLVTYSAVFFVGKVNDIAYVNKHNYLVYLIVGSLAYLFSHECWRRTTLVFEKMMLTLQGVMLAPVSRIYLLAGKALNAVVFGLLSAVPHVLLLLFLRPAILSYARLVMGVVALFFVMSIFISLDFIVTAIELSEEGQASLIRAWAPRGVTIFACVYYPIDVIPKVLRPLAIINPAYHGVQLLRSAFIEGPKMDLFLSFLYLAVLALILPIIAVRYFDYRFRKYGIKGY